MINGIYVEDLLDENGEWLHAEGCTDSKPCLYCLTYYARLDEKEGKK